MVINKLSGVMRVPFMLVWLTLIVAAMLYLVVTGDWKSALAIADLALILTFVGSVLATFVRGLRIDRHSIAKLPNDEFRALCQANADARITFYDSVRSGNCILGSLGFARRTFNWPRRRSITLGELLPYCRTGWRVRQVANYTLIQLSKRSALRPIRKEEAL
jgi:hypothetical protein